MKPFFGSLQNYDYRVCLLQQAATSWIETPFMPNASIKRSGVSCQKLVGAIYSEIGVVPPDFAIPEGPMDWCHANKRSLIAAFMGALPMFELVTDHSYMVGDMVGFEIGGCVHHCGIMISEDFFFIHCLRGRGVLYSNLRDATYLKRLKMRWRPLCL